MFQIQICIFNAKRNKRNYGKKMVKHNNLIYMPLIMFWSVVRCNFLNHAQSYVPESIKYSCISQKLICISKYIQSCTNHAHSRNSFITTGCTCVHWAWLKVIVIFSQMCCPLFVFCYVKITCMSRQTYAVLKQKRHLQRSITYRTVLDSQYWLLYLPIKVSVSCRPLSASVSMSKNGCSVNWY